MFLQEDQGPEAPQDLSDGSGPRSRGTTEKPPAAIHGLAWVLDVDDLERGGEAVGIAFAPHLAVGDDVDAGPLHVADRDDGRVVLRFGKEFARHAPELGLAHARHLRSQLGAGQ
jgi:hypothetical protein